MPLFHRLLSACFRITVERAPTSPSTTQVVVVRSPLRPFEASLVVSVLKRKVAFFSSSLDVRHRLDQFVQRSLILLPESDLSPGNDLDTIVVTEATLTQLLDSPGICADGEAAPPWSTFDILTLALFHHSPRYIRVSSRVSLRPKLTLHFGNPSFAPHSLQSIRDSLQKDYAAILESAKPELLDLAGLFITSARRHPFRKCMADLEGSKCYLSALTGAIFLARRLSGVLGQQPHVGILLPPSLGGALFNWAVLLIGKVPVNLNYTLSKSALDSCIEQSRLTQVITSERLLKTLDVKLQVPHLAGEELAEEPRVLEMVKAAFLSLFLPIGHLRKQLTTAPLDTINDTATVIFTSGSTGIPKGVPLTHFNIISNVWQLDQTFQLEGEHRILGVMPLFHSFGFTATLVAPVAYGLASIFYRDPRNAKVIASLVEKHQVTIALATPTLFQFYLKGAKPEQFGSIQFAVVGAEKLQAQLAEKVFHRFGFPLLEAYGCTECSPVLTCNVLPRSLPSSSETVEPFQSCNAGKPLPGIRVRITPLEAAPDSDGSEPGSLWVKGPNVMNGYLDRPEASAEALDQGWYQTGDVAIVHHDGSVSLVDRISRFSKIGGEMVPHVEVETALSRLAPTEEGELVVTGIPDSRKGERLVVLHTLPEDALAQLTKRLNHSSLPNLWRPKAPDFVRVSELPVLGTGKVDLRGIKKIALNNTERSSVSPC